MRKIQIACSFAQESSTIKKLMRAMETDNSIELGIKIDSILCSSVLLTRYIELVSHEMIRRKRSKILDLIQHLKQLLTQENVLVNLIEERFTSATGHLIRHIERLELIVFPFVRAICQSSARRDLFHRPPYNRIRLQIRELVQALQLEGIHRNKISELTEAYVPSEDFSSQFEELMNQLADLHLDINELVDLEQHILFPHILSALAQDLSPSTPSVSSHEN
jgi:iron-sulfur cluster repair protein YtfE (RIC family)